MIDFTNRKDLTPVDDETHLEADLADASQEFVLESQEELVPSIYSNWKFLIPHDWETESVEWEDVYLMPDDDNYSGESIWLTVDAVDIPLEVFYERYQVHDENLNVKKNKASADSRYETNQRLIKAMGDKDYFISENDDMSVRAASFNKIELLEWAKIYLQEQGVKEPSLREGELEEFAGSNQHALNIEIAKEEYNKLMDEFGDNEDLHEI